MDEFELGIDPPTCVWLHMDKGDLGEVTQQSKGTLAHFRCLVLHAAEQQLQDVAAGNEALNAAFQTLGKACQRSGG